MSTVFTQRLVFRWWNINTCYASDLTSISAILFLKLEYFEVISARQYYVTQVLLSNNTVIIAVQK